MEKAHHRVSCILECGYDARVLVLSNLMECIVLAYLPAPMLHVIICNIVPACKKGARRPLRIAIYP